MASLPNMSVCPNPLGIITPITQTTRAERSRYLIILDYHNYHKTLPLDLMYFHSSHKIQMLSFGKCENGLKIISA